jgi:hypothetical protein
MRWVWVLVIAIVAGCETGDDDDGHSMPIPECYIVEVIASCYGDTATIETHWAGGSTSLTLCHKPPELATAACESGCAVQGDYTWHKAPTDPVAPSWSSSPVSLCAGVPPP